MARGGRQKGGDGRAGGDPPADAAKPEKTKRCTEREYEERLARAGDYMLLGWTDRRTAATMAEEYGVGIAQARNYIADVKARWAEEARARTDRPAEDVLKEHAERFRMLAELCIRERNYKTAVTAAERLAQLDGLLTTKAVTHSGKVGLDLNPEVDEAAAEVLRARGWAAPEPPADPPSE